MPISTTSTDANRLKPNESLPKGHNNIATNQTAIQAFQDKLKDYQKLYLSSMQSSVVAQAINSMGDAGGGHNATDDIERTLSFVENTMILESHQKMSESMDKLTKELSASELRNAMSFQGKRVCCDNSMQNYDGTKPVVFPYNIKHNRLPQGASGRVNLRITNEDGILVLEDNERHVVAGSNQFTWDGKDSSGKLCPAGKYKINITAIAENQNGILTDIEATTYTEGVITELRVSKEGKAQGLINGKWVNIDTIEMIKEDHSLLENIDNYIQLIGKQVNCDLSRFQVRNGQGTIKYYNTINNPSKVKIEIVDSNNRSVKTIDYQGNLQQNFGTINLDLSNLNDGNYNYKIFVYKTQDDVINETPVELESQRTINVTGVDRLSKTLIDGDNNKYPAINVDTIRDSIMDDKSLFNQASMYIGKQVQFNKSKFKYEGEPFALDVRIPKPPEGTQLERAILEIYDPTNERVRHITKEGPELYHYEVEPVPTYAALDQGSKNRVNEYIYLKFARNDIDFNALTILEQAQIAPYIEQEFRAGRLWKQGQNRDNNTKNRNMGTVPMTWDGRDINNIQLPYGDYTHQIKVITSQNNHESTEIINTSGISRVRTVDIENGCIMLNLANGSTINADDALVIS